MDRQTDGQPHGNPPTYPHILQGKVTERLTTPATSMSGGGRTDPSDKTAHTLPYLELRADANRAGSPLTPATCPA